MELCEREQHTTFLTDTRHTQGSSTPVPALALILQGKENCFLQRTQLACTGSLRGKMTMEPWTQASVSGQICCLFLFVHCGWRRCGGGFWADDGKCFRFKQVESATAALCSLTPTQLHTRYLVSCRASHFSLLDTRLTVCFSCTFFLIFIFKFEVRREGGIFVSSKHHAIHFYTIWKRHCWQCLMFDVSRP